MVVPVEKNSFATKLQQLMQLSGMKNAVLAKAVQYDLSYISKWLSGKMLPSEKNIDELIGVIVDSLVLGKKENLSQLYGCKDDELRSRLATELREAYDKSRPKPQLSHFMQSRPLSELVDTVVASLKSADKVLAVVDILSMPHESRLHLVGIYDGYFKDITSASEYNMVISLDSKDCAYDSIFLIHMLTGLSGLNFNIYNGSVAKGKLIYCIDENAYSAFLFPGNKDCVAVGITENGEEIKKNITPFVDQENLIFRKTTMSELVERRDYIQTLLSTNICWILGHATELLIPQDVFSELVEKKDNCDELEKLYLLSQNILSKGLLRVMIYESVLADLVVDGTLDFYNTPVKLTVSQCLRCFSYYENLVNSGVPIRLIDGGFSDDFRYITNPCMFLSDSVCYLRLENNRYRDNILLVNDRMAKDMFYDFFEDVWENREDVVTSVKKDIIEKISHYRLSAEVLKKE